MKMASKSIDLISKKTNCTCSTLFVVLCRCFAQLQRCFVRLKLQTSLIHIIFMEELSYVFMFAFIFHCRLFSLCWQLVSFSLSHSRFEFSRNSSLLFSITRSSSFSVIHLGCHICRLNYFTLVCLWCGRTVGRTGGPAEIGRRAVYGHVITKFSGMGSLPHFFTHGAPLRASHARVALIRTPLSQNSPIFSSKKNLYDTDSL